MKEKINNKQMRAIRRLYNENKHLLRLCDSYNAKCDDYFKQQISDIETITKLENDLWGSGVDEKTFAKMQREVKLYKFIMWMFLILSCILGGILCGGIH